MKSAFSCFLRCLITLTVGAILFVVWPSLDLIVSNWFYVGQGIFPANDYWFVIGIYQGAPILGRLLFFMALFVVVTAICLPEKISRRFWRRSAALVTVVILGVGLLVHAVLKDGMGRPRPRDVHAFAGVTSFVPVMTTSQFCQTNCSFVSGHAAIGFSLMSFGMFAVRKRRQFWMKAAVLVGGGIGLVRIAQGGHFLSDIIFSFIAIWFSFILIRSVWLRFRVWQLCMSPVTRTQIAQII